MNRQIFRAVLTGLLLLPFLGCTRHDEPERIGSRHAKTGPVTIGDVYRIRGDHALIAFVDPPARTVYVDQSATDRVKKALSVSTDRGQMWVLGHAALEGEYRVMALEALDLRQPLVVGMAAVSSKTKCSKTAKGECANMYDGDKFIYSWQPTEDVFMCDWADSQDCTDIWREVTIKTFPEKKCKGNPTTRKEELPFCSPA